MIEWINVDIGYRSASIFQHFNLRIPPGVTVIIGPNGSGKSTLLRSAAGILPVKQGSIRIDGNDIKTVRRRDLARQIAFFPQTREIPDMTVESFVLHGRYPYLSWSQRLHSPDYAHCIQAMEQTGILNYRTRKLRTLSGGERQKAYLAMTIAQDTQWMLFDEPTVFLDLRFQFDLLSQICSFSKTGKSIVLVLHDLQQALELGTNIVVLDKGKLCFSGTTNALYESGILQTIFGVQVRRFWDMERWNYHFMPMQIKNLTKNITKINF